MLPFCIRHFHQVVSLALQGRHHQVEGAPSSHLHLVLLEAPLPDGDVGSQTVLTEVDEDIHAVLSHGLTLVDIVVVPVADDLFGGSRCFGLELFDVFLRFTNLLQFLGKGLHVF